VLEDLFLAALSRRPTAQELERFAAFVGRRKSPRDGYARALWVLINSSEFLLTP
jgi:hypothetical protein